MRKHSQKSVATTFFVVLTTFFVVSCASQPSVDNPPTDFERGEETMEPWGCLESKVFGREVDC
jgi:hypothetical protein